MLSPFIFLQEKRNVFRLSRRHWLGNVLERTAERLVSGIIVVASCVSPERLVTFATAVMR